jgi:SET domain-containing protein
MKMRVWVGTSRMAGKGLFAPQEIKKGIRLIQYTGQRISQEETADRLNQGNQYIFTFNDRYNIDSKTLTNKARSINHPCDPNCEMLITQRTIWIVAKHDIQEGEELSDNYGFTAKQYRCQCGAHNCYGYMLGEEYWHS